MFSTSPLGCLKLTTTTAVTTAMIGFGTPLFLITSHATTELLINMNRFSRLFHVYALPSPSSDFTSDFSLHSSYYLLNTPVFWFTIQIIEYDIRLFEIVLIFNHLLSIFTVVAYNITSWHNWCRPIAVFLPWDLSTATFLCKRRIFKRVITW